MKVYVCSSNATMESDKERSHRQPVMADEVQTFKALITIHKVLQEGHPVSVKEAQQNVNWIESLARGVSGEGLRGTFFPFDVRSGDKDSCRLDTSVFMEFAMARRVLTR
jgi:ANTH domain